MTKSSQLPRQISLDIGHEPGMTLDNFIATGNENLLSALHKIYTIAPNQPPEERMIHLWGASGCGRTHLLTALQSGDSSIHRVYLNPQSDPSAWRKISLLIESGSPSLLCVDDIDYLDDFSQGALFRLHNLVRESVHSYLISTSSLPPASLRVRDDLRTRLAWGLVFQMHNLSDNEKMKAIELAAHQRGMNLSPEVAPWLIKHFHRDMPSLMAMIEALDVYSLETKRAVTLPLLKEMLEQKN